jgi:Protein of unknown function (DUF3307)
MTETLAALIFAHVLADFVFQTNWMATNKLHPAALLIHVVTVFLTAAFALGTLNPLLMLLAGVHLAIDVLKAISRLKGIWPFLADQALHLISLIALAMWMPTLWAGGFWVTGFAEEGGWLDFGSDTPLPLPAWMALVAGFVLATRAGGFAVGLLMEPWGDVVKGGLPGGGRVIGNLERALVFLLVLTGQAASIGFLIAAKSVLRFTTVKDERKFSEYVIIGTLASFAWAIGAATLTVMALQVLPGIALPDLIP